ncbi:MAG: hypothetical protein FJ265_05810 [Planctomycetes bacterium]|nr:hypothetical protein [Planctomycetota bacterium]
MRHCRLLPLLALASLGSCFAGPHQLRRSVDDWDRRLYVQSPWLDVGLWIVPVIPAATLLAWAGDFLLCDAVSFWGGDAWDGNGTGFVHARVEPDEWYESLVFDRGRWLRVEKHDLRPGEKPKADAK